ncbi:MAG: hypothetical protein ABR548_02365 [Actinomycetota bacterium]|nr:hypothetical protein [Actinomycetota bacterium]
MTEEAIGRALLEPEAPLETAEPEEPSIAIAGVTPATLEPDEKTVAAPPEEELARRPEDWLIVVAGAVLAASVFMPWYSASNGPSKVSLSGWGSGTWASLILFLAAATIALVVLRRMRIRVALPFPESIVLEAFGWIGTLSGILKARLRPTIAPLGLKFSVSAGVWIAIGAALALALLAGRVSGKSPFVPVPGWWRGKAGKIGLALLAVVVVGSAAFGLTSTYKPPKAGSGSSALPPSPGVVKGKIPDCAKGFPIPSGIKPFTGSGGATCVAIFQTTMKAPATVAAFKAALTKAGYKFTSQTAGQGSTSIRLTGPRCGSISIVAPQQGPVYISLVLSRCAAAPTTSP